MSIESLAGKVASLIQKANAGTGKSTGIKRGYVSDNQVLVDGRWYPFDCAVDMDIYDGELVYVEIADNGSIAVMVGK